MGGVRACGFATWHVVRSAIVCGRRARRRAVSGRGSPAPAAGRVRRATPPSCPLPPPRTRPLGWHLSSWPTAAIVRLPAPATRWRARAWPRRHPALFTPRRALALPQVAFQGQWWQLGGAVRPETRSLPPHPGPAALEPAPTRPCAPLISRSLAAHIISILPHAPHPRPPSVGREAAPAAPGHACPGAPCAPPPSDRRPPAPAPAPAPAGAGGEDLGPHRRRPRPVPDE